MPIPIIDTSNLSHTIIENAEFIWQPIAANSPTVWSCSDLPSGFSINTSTGLITGVCSVPSVYSCLLSAANTDGIHTVTLYVSVVEDDVDVAVGPNNITLEMDVDLSTGKVTFLGTEGAAWGPPITNQRVEGNKPTILLVKRGDRFPVAVGFRKYGVLQDLPIDRLRISAKEFDTEGLIDLTNGVFRKIGSGASTRYLTDMVIGSNLWEGVLSTYEDESGTYVDAKCEQQLVIVNGFGYEAVEQTRSINLETEVTKSHVFWFYDLPMADFTASFELSMFPVSTPASKVALDKTYEFTWSDGAFSVRDTDAAVLPVARWKHTYETSVDLTLTTNSVTSLGDISGTRGEIFRLYDTEGNYKTHIPINSHDSGIWKHLPGNSTYYRGSNTVTAEYDANGNFVKWNIVWNPNGHNNGDTLAEVAGELANARGYVDLPFAARAEYLTTSTIRLTLTRSYILSTTEVPSHYSTSQPEIAGHILGPAGTQFDWTPLSHDIEAVSQVVIPVNTRLENYNGTGGLYGYTIIQSVQAVGSDVQFTLGTYARRYSEGSAPEIPFTVQGVLEIPEAVGDTYVKTSETFVLRVSSDMIETDNQALTL